MSFRDSLPQIYESFLPKAFLGFDPEEKLATCDSCRMVRPAAKGRTAYSPETKCCTFYPFLPNFLVGAGLAEGDGETLSALIDARRGTLPIGLVAPEGYQNVFLSKRADEFGRRIDLLCPHYDNGRCRIWKARGHECATFFCESSYGEKGEAYWNRVREALNRLETGLSQLCLLERGYSDEEIEHQLAQVRLVDPKSRPYSYATGELELYWQHVDFNSAGAIEDFYIGCYDFVRNEHRRLRADLAEVVELFSGLGVIS